MLAYIQHAFTRISRNPTAFVCVFFTLTLLMEHMLASMLERRSPSDCVPLKNLLK